MSTDPAGTAHIEDALVTIWRDVLELDDIDPDDDFFDRGGNSFAAARITSRLREAFALPRLPLMLIFEYSTINELAGAIEELLDEDHPALDGHDTTNR